MSQYKLNTIEAHPFVQVRFLTILILFYLFNGYTSEYHTRIYVCLLHVDYVFLSVV